MSQLQIESDSVPSDSVTTDSFVTKKLESEDSPTATIESLTLNFPFEDRDTSVKVRNWLNNIKEWGVVATLHTIYREEPLHILVPNKQLPYLTDEFIQSLSDLKGQEVQYSIVGPDEIEINENTYTVIEDFDPEPPRIIRGSGIADDICNANKKVCNKYLTEASQYQQFSDPKVGWISEVSSVDNELIMTVTVENDSYMVTEELPKLWHESDSVVRFIEEVGEGSIELLEGEEVEMEWLSNHDGVSLDDYPSVRVRNKQYSEETEESDSPILSLWSKILVMSIIVTIGFVFGIGYMGMAVFVVYCFYACKKGL